LGGECLGQLLHFSIQPFDGETAAKPICISISNKVKHVSLDLGTVHYVASMGTDMEGLTFDFVTL